MNDEDKVYHPTEILDQPLPGVVAPEMLSSTSGNTQQVSTTPTTKVQPLPARIIAHETIGAALNTKSKKILQEFELVNFGGIRVGKYQNGVSGEVVMTPAGISARDLAGNTTFALDGETGDAVFAGELRSGTLITGQVAIGDGSIVLDEAGLISTNNFLKATTSHGTTEDFTTTSFVDLTNTQTFTLARSTLLLIMSTVTMFLIESAGNTGDGSIALDIDGVVNNQALLVIRSGNNFAHTYTFTYPVTLSAGSHTIKLKGKFDGISAGSPILRVLESYLSRLQLGS